MFIISGTSIKLECINGLFMVFRGQFFDKHLKFIKLNHEFVPFRSRDLSHLMQVNCTDKFNFKIVVLVELVTHHYLIISQVL